MRLPTLYKVQGKSMREWTVSVDRDVVKKEHGLVDGAHGVSSYVASEKHAGKANYISSSDQAVREAIALHKNKIERKGYSFSHSEAKSREESSVSPMLALDYRKVPHRLNWSEGVAMQPKLDGARVLFNRAGQFLSRGSKTYHFPHLQESAKRLLDTLNSRTDKEVLALDGEIYVRGKSLGEIMSLIKGGRGLEAEVLELHVFDLVVREESYQDRRDRLWALKSQSFQGIRVVPWVTTYTASVMDDYHDECVGQGYEGIVMRPKSGEYETTGKRSGGLFKYKKFFDAEFRIGGVEADKAGCAVFRCETGVGGDFRVAPKRTKPVKVAMMLSAEQYVGQWITVQYQTIGKLGVPQFPVGLEIREENEF